MKPSTKYLAIMGRLAVAAYVITSLPIILVLTKSEYSRFIIIQTVTGWRGKINGIHSAHLGDSITAAGRNWGRFLDALNLAGNGYTVRQITKQVSKAVIYRPKQIFILAGINDIIDSDQFDLDQFQKDYNQLLDRTIETGIPTYVTLIPFTSHEKYNSEISRANEVILNATKSKGIPTIDLNPTIAPNGILLPNYTIDGIHLSRSAYPIWRTKIQNTAKSGNNY